MDGLNPTAWVVRCPAAALQGVWHGNEPRWTSVIAGWVGNMDCFRGDGIDGMGWDGMMVMVVVDGRKW